MRERCLDHRLARCFRTQSGKYLYPLNTLFKLLTEEPEKLERLIILFLKFVVTIGLFEPLFSCGNLIGLVLNDQFEFWSFTGESIKYASLFICFWFIIWTLFAEILLGAGIRLTSRLFKAEETVGDLIKGVDKIIIKPKNKKHINYAIIHLDNFIGNRKASDGLSVSDLRIDKYFELYAVITLFILCSERVNLSVWQGVLWWVTGINLAVSYAFFHHLIRFFNTSFQELKAETQRLAYIERARIALSNLERLSTIFTIEHGARKIRLRLKENSGMYQDIKILPFHSADNPALQEMASLELHEMSQRNPRAYISLYITNSPIRVSESALKRANSSIIIANNEIEIKERLELFLTLYRRSIASTFQAKTDQEKELP